MRPTGGSGRRSRDHIEIRELRVMGVHGVLAEEQSRPQPFSLDVDVWLDMSAAAASDALGDTVDYAGVITIVAAVVTTRSFALLEALAAAAASAVLEADDKIRAVSLSVKKLRPPVPFHVGSVGVRVLRRRETESEEGQ